jgi:hypothetical protein
LNSPLTPSFGTPLAKPPSGLRQWLRRDRQPTDQLSDTMYDRDSEPEVGPM